MSAEVNYGIRFTQYADAEKFVNELAAELENRLCTFKVKGKCITLKLKVSWAFCHPSAILPHYILESAR